MNKNQNIAVTVFLFSLATFTVSQLVINSILSPLGIELQALNSEKNYLLEENRSMEEQIAKSNSIYVITHLAEENLQISSNNEKTLIYVEDTTILAGRQ